MVKPFKWSGLGFGKFKPRAELCAGCLLLWRGLAVLFAGYASPATLLASDPSWMVPVQPIQAITQLQAPPRDELVRIQGLVTQWTPGQWIRVKDRTGSLLVKSSQTNRLTNDVFLDVIGKLEWQQGAPQLIQARYRRLGAGLGTPPEQLSQSNRPSLNGNSLPVLRQASAIRQLDTRMAERGYPVWLQGVITYYDPVLNDCFIQDETAGIWIDTSDAELDLAPGDWVDLDAYTRSGFAPSLTRPHFQILGRSQLPQRNPVTLSHLLTGQDDGQWVKVTGVVRTVDQEDSALVFKLEMENGGRMNAHIPGVPNQAALRRLEAARVQMQGVCSSLFNTKQQLISVQLLVPHTNQITVITPSAPNPFLLPLRSPQELMQYRPQENYEPRVRVQGVVTLLRIGKCLFIENDTNGLYVELRSPVDLKPGDRVELVGFPSVGSISPILQDALCKRIGSGSLMPPPVVTIGDALSGKFDANVVQIDALLLEQTTRGGDQNLMLRAGQFLFDAVLEQGQGGNGLGHLRSGSMLRLTGVCSLQVNENREPKSFRLLLRDGKDIRVIKPPSAWLFTYAYQLAAVLAVVALAALSWIVLLRHKVRQQTALVRENLLREAALEEQFRILVENAPDGIFIQVAGLFAYLNPAALTLLGATSPQDLLGRPVMERFHADYHAAIRERIKQLNTERRPVPWLEEKFLKLDGASFEVEVCAVPITFNAQPGALIFFRDITARKRTEEEKSKLETQLRQAQKMEAIGTLAGGIAHDFNNILGIIIPYAELAQMDAGHNNTVREGLNQIIKAANRAKDLVQQILAFSRQSKSEHKPILMQPIIKEVLKMMRSTIPSSVEIVDKTDLSTPQIMADPIQIHQVLVNLCTNAAYAMRDQTGRLEITLDVFEADEAFFQHHTGLPPGRYARLAVRDSGRGMDSETLKRIFEPFFTTKGPGSGTGLGLAVVHGIVKDHKGAIEVYSQPGKGTIFHLYFPACGAQLPPSQPNLTPQVLPQGQGERILFVDDEKHLVNVAETLLVRCGYLVKTHTQPETALDDFRQQPHRYDLIITDLTMPKMTGTEFARRILDIRADIPILLATGFSGSLTRDEIRQRGICDVILKPVTPALLAKSVYQALHAQSPAHQASIPAT